MRNLVNWFEIYVDDFDRAINFYQGVFGVELRIVEAMGDKMAFFPENYEQYGIAGSLVKGEHYKPSADGTTVYFDCGKDLLPVMQKITESGGKQILEKTPLPDSDSYIALAFDCEGNKIGLYSHDSADYQV